MALNRTVILHQQHLLPCSQLRWDLMPQKLLKLVFALLDFPFQIILLLQLLKMWHQSMTFMNKLYKPTVYSMSYRYSSLKKISNSQTPSGTKNCQNSKSPTPEAKIGTYEGGAGQLGGKSAWERGPSRDKGKEPWGTANTLIKIPLRKSRFKETILYRHRKEIEISRELQESDCSHDCSVNQTHTHTHEMRFCSRDTKTKQPRKCAKPMCELQCDLRTILAKEFGMFQCSSKLLAPQFWIYFQSCKTFCFRMWNVETWPTLTLIKDLTDDLHLMTTKETGIQHFSSPLVDQRHVCETV